MTDKKTTKTISVLKCSTLDFFSAVLSGISFPIGFPAPPPPPPVPVRLSAAKASGSDHSTCMASVPGKYLKAFILPQQCCWELEALQGLPSPSSGLFHHFLFLLPLVLFSFREAVTSLLEMDLTGKKQVTSYHFIYVQMSVFANTFTKFYLKLRVCKNMYRVHMHMYGSFHLIPAYKRF